MVRSFAPHSLTHVNRTAGRDGRKPLKPAAARAEETLAGGLLDMAPLAAATAAEVSAALASKGLRVQEVRLRQSVPVVRVINAAAVVAELE